ncbi:hypothetical protein U0070_025696, partial [Myodes glareolus]
KLKPPAKARLGLRHVQCQPGAFWVSSFLPRCSQGPAAGQLLSSLVTNRKESIPLRFSEDCLYLNIYTPADLTKNVRLPVMVWIHGGGVVDGASTYDGLPLSAHENVVVVTIQYRLGIWGFFSTEDEHSRGNWGHLDQIAALRWVQDNIANFGGDPGLGPSLESQQEVSVLSPLAKNLFRRAISQSSVILNPCLFGRDARPLAKYKVAAAAGCKTTTSATMVHCLRQKTEDELLEVAQKMVDVWFSDFLSDPREILAEKNFNTVPYMVGITKKEFGWITPMMIGFPLSEDELDEKRIASLLWHSYPILNISESLIPAVIEKYISGADNPIRRKDLLQDLMGDAMFGAPSVIVSHRHRSESQSQVLHGRRIQAHQLGLQLTRPLKLSVMKSVDDQASKAGSLCPVIFSFTF